MNGSPDQASAAEASELSLDEIIDALDQPYTGKVPERALRAAQRQKAEITPRLVELLRAAIVDARADEFRETDLYYLTMLLLVEFQADEALPLLLELCRLQDNEIDQLVGDFFYDYVPAMLASLSGSIDAIDALVFDRDLARYVRMAIPETYLYWVRDGKITREEAAEHLRKNLARAVAERDDVVPTWILHSLLNMGPSDAREEIDAAFGNDLIERAVVSPNDVDEAIAMGDAEFIRAVNRLRATGVPDTVELLKSWETRFGTKTTSKTKPSSGFMVREHVPDDEWDRGDINQFKPAAPLHTAQKKVGRNDLCPCRSGKKFKKCCGRH